MLRYIIITVFIGITFIQADDTQCIENIQNLKAENKALVLQLEAYSLKKKIIEMKNFIEEDKIQKEKKIEREKALVRFKNDLRASRNRVHRVHLVYAR